MTYEQSWQNIYKLLSLVRAIDGHSICFEFSTNTEGYSIEKVREQFQQLAGMAKKS